MSKNDRFRHGMSFKYSPVEKCKSAGIIPYCIHNNTIKFLLHKYDQPRHRDAGWNDFGGKRIDEFEPTAKTAAREFSEETSCLFYLKEIGKIKEYELLKNNPELHYDPKTICTLKELIKESTDFFERRIGQFAVPIYVSSKETYISYLVKVEYIDVNDIPAAEDIHLDYETKYLRTCQWFTADDISVIGSEEFHKRLQITHLQDKIHDCYLWLFK